MYDDLHRYSKPGAGEFAQKNNVDNFDEDPSTVSTYDEKQKKIYP